MCISLSLRKALNTYDFFDLLLFLFFVTLHADSLSFEVMGYTIRLNNLIGLYLLAVFVTAFRYELWKIDKRLFIGVIFLCFSVFLSFLASPYKGRCIFYFGWFLFTILFYLLLPYFLVRFLGAQRVFSLYLASFLCVGGYALFQFVLSAVGIQDPFNMCQPIVGTLARPQAFCREPCYYVTYMTPFVCLYNFYFLSDSDNHFFIFKRRSYLMFGVINLMYLISTSAAVVFAYFAFIGALFLGSTIKKMKIFKLGFLFCSAGVAIGLLFPLIIKNYLLRFFYHGFFSHHSIYERWWGITDSWKVFLQHPFLGVGLGGLPKYLEAAFLKGDSTFDFFYCYLPRNSELFIKEPLALFDSTNIITELLASLGILGGGVFLLMGQAVISLFIKSAKENKVLASNLLVSTFVMGVVFCFYSGLLRTYIWTHVALVYVLLESILNGSVSNSQFPKDLDRYGLSFWHEENFSSAGCS